MKKPTFQQRFQYWFDKFMSRGTSAMLIGLLILSGLIILLDAALVKDTNSAPNGDSFMQVAWMGLLRTLDSGTMGGDTGKPIFLALMLFVTFGGVFVVSALIVIINNGLEDKLDELRKGRSLVLEKDHTLILGWNAQIYNIISELVIANENRKSGAVIVVLASQDKVEMEDAIRERVPDSKNTKIICRSGNPLDLTDLEIASPPTARSIIILPEGSDPDTHVIKSVLAITNNPKRRQEPYHIVTQIREPKNMDVVKMVGQKDKVLPILTNDLIARVVAQTSRQSGLSIVYTELMNFGGDEIYFKHEPALTGKTFGEALLAYEDSCLMGLRKSDGKILLSPSMDTRIEESDQIFALSADDDTIHLSSLGLPPINEAVIRSNRRALQTQPEKCLILGWNRSGTTIVHELDNYVAKGSQVTVVADIYNIEKQMRAQVGKTKNQTLTVREGETTDRDLLNQLGVADYDHVV